MSMLNNGWLLGLYSGDLYLGGLYSGGLIFGGGGAYIWNEVSVSIGHTFGNLKKSKFYKYHSYTIYIQIRECYWLP